MKSGGSALRIAEATIVAGTTTRVHRGGRPSAKNFPAREIVCLKPGVLLPTSNTDGPLRLAMRGPFTLRERSFLCRQRDATTLNRDSHGASDPRRRHGCI